MTKAKAQMFSDYAWDAEGMKFEVVHVKADCSGDSYSVRPIKGTDYDPQVIASVKRSFESDWKAFGREA